ncbi:MAG TPA: hypothetical protein VGG48_20080 [Rhizomicrobium sp.]|jgi:hypothetical protein
MKTLLAAFFALIAFAAVPAAAGTAPNYNPPFGLWRLPLDGSAPFNMSTIGFDPATSKPADVFAQLNAARTAHIHVLLTLVDFGKMQEDPPGNFQISRWRARYGAWCTPQCLNLKPYVDDGTLLGIHIFEYSSAESAAQRATPTMDQIQQVAAVVKSLWPYAPVSVDSAHPCLLNGQDWQGTVDIVAITLFTIRQMDFAHGDALFNREVACVRQLGMRFTLGPNPFGGLQTGMTPTSLSSFVHYTEFSLLYPGSMGTYIWRYWPSEDASVTNGRKTFANFWSEQVNPGITAAMHEIEACAAQRTRQACPHAGGSYAESR